MVGITGRLNTRSYEKGEGIRVFVTEVIVEDIRFLATKNRDETEQSKEENKQVENDFEFPADQIKKLPV